MNIRELYDVMDDYEKLKKILENGGKACLEDIDMKNIINSYLFLKQYKMLELILSYGAKINMEHCLSAVSLGYEEILCLFLEFLPIEIDYICFVEAVKKQNKNILKILCDYSTEISPKIFIKIVESKDLEIIEYYLVHGADPNVPFEEYFFDYSSNVTWPLDIAIFLNNFDIVELLIKYRARLVKPMMIINACYKKNEKIVKLLVEQGRKDIISDVLNTLIFYREFSCIEMILKYDPKIDDEKIMLLFDMNKKTENIIKNINITTQNVVEYGMIKCVEQINHRLLRFLISKYSHIGLSYYIVLGDAIEINDIGSISILKKYISNNITSGMIISCNLKTLKYVIKYTPNKVLEESTIIMKSYNSEYCNKTIHINYILKILQNRYLAIYNINKKVPKEVVKQIFAYF